MYVSSRVEEAQQPGTMTSQRKRRWRCQPCEREFSIPSPPSSVQDFSGRGYVYPQVSTGLLYSVYQFECFSIQETPSGM